MLTYKYQGINYLLPFCETRDFGRAKHFSPQAGVFVVVAALFFAAGKVFSGHLLKNVKKISPIFLFATVDKKKSAAFAIIRRRVLFFFRHFLPLDVRT